MIDDNCDNDEDYPHGDPETGVRMGIMCVVLFVAILVVMVLA